MNERPDSALHLLEQVQTETLSRQQYADWCLFLTQARDKCDSVFTSDSLINIAVGYYEKHNNPAKQMLAYYYKGRVMLGKHQAPEAQEYYLKALTADKLSNNYGLLGRICSQLGMLYNMQQTYDMALPYLKKTEFYFSQASDTVNHPLSLRNLARTYNLLQQLDSSITYYQQALIRVSENSKPFILNELAGLYHKKGSLDSAYNYAQQALEYDKGEGDFTPIYLVNGKIHLKCGNSDSASYYLNKCVNSPKLQTRIAAYHYLFQLARENKHWEDYARFQTQHEILSDSLSTITNTQMMRQVESLYNYQQAQDVANQAKLNQATTERNGLIIAILAVVITFSLIGYIFYLKTKQIRKNNLFKNLLRRIKRMEIKDNKEQLEINKQQIKALRKFDHTQTDSEYALLELALIESINTFIEKRIAEKEKEAEIKEDKVTHFKMSEDYKLFLAGDTSLITSKMKIAFGESYKEAYPTHVTAIHKLSTSPLPDKLLLMLYLLKMGLTQSRIALIINTSAPNIIKWRKKVAKNMFGSETATDELDEFIDSL